MLRQPLDLRAYLGLKDLKDLPGRTGIQGQSDPRGLREQQDPRGLREQQGPKDLGESRVFQAQEYGQYFLPRTT